jgi:hypothetical protein
MKQFLMAVSLLALAVSPTQAGSIELVDSNVTGPIGPSMIVLGSIDACSAENCGSAGEAKVIVASVPSEGPGFNVIFARKYPDPAVPTPAPSADGGASSTPSAPADVGNIPAQPPMNQSRNATQEQAAQQNSQAASQSPIEQAAAMDPAASSSSNAKIVPLADSELREAN